MRGGADGEKEREGKMLRFEIIETLWDDAWRERRLRIHERRGKSRVSFQKSQEGRGFRVQVEGSCVASRTKFQLRHWVEGALAEEVRM